MIDATPIARTSLASYLFGFQDNQEWALVDNLSADDVRDLAKAAIRMLREANTVIGLASVGLDKMAPRTQRLQFHDLANAAMEPYLAMLLDLKGEVA